MSKNYFQSGESIPVNSIRNSTTSNCELQKLTSRQQSHTVRRYTHQYFSFNHNLIFQYFNMREKCMMNISIKSDPF
jgi:hypothetical protein